MTLTTLAPLATARRLFAIFRRPRRQSVRALHHEHAGTRVGELVAEELALVGGVDRHLDRSELAGREERDDLLGPMIGAAVVLAHAALRFGWGSPDDCLGYTVTARRAVTVA